MKRPLLLLLLALAVACTERKQGITELRAEVAGSEVIAASEGMGCPPDCARRRANGDELLAIQQQINKMSTCPEVQQSLNDHLSRIQIITDPAYKEVQGGYWAEYGTGTTEIALSITYWERLQSGQYSQNFFEAALFDVLKHEGAHDAAYDSGAYDDLSIDDDYHTEAWSSRYNVCMAS